MTFIQCHSFAEWFGNGAQCQRERSLDFRYIFQCDQSDQSDCIFRFCLMWFKGFKGSSWGLDGSWSCWKQRAKVSDTMQAEIWSLGDEMRGMNEMRNPKHDMFWHNRIHKFIKFYKMRIMAFSSLWCWCSLKASSNSSFANSEELQQDMLGIKKNNDNNRSIPVKMCQDVSMISVSEHVLDWLWHHGGIFCTDHRIG